jgi:hypothetical protein
MRLLLGSYVATCPNLPAGAEPLGTKLVEVTNFEVLVPTSHTSFRSDVVVLFCPPNTIILFDAGSNTAVCEKRAGGPY